MRTWRTGAWAVGALLPLLAMSAAASAPAASDPPVPWGRCLRQPPQWYRSDEARRVADNVLLYQRACGGWPKNVDMARALSADERRAVAGLKAAQDATIDNGATYTQLAFLARVDAPTGDGRCRDGFFRGLDYLLEAQYDNGGWPQYYPNARGYHRHVTFNDDAMVGVLRVLGDVAGKEAVYAFVDDARRRRARAAVARGVDCILRCQVIRTGRRTAWCAQHDAETLAPADARAYEKASLSGHETVGILRFLMEQERPAPEVVAAVEAGVAWLEGAKLAGLRLERRPDASLPKGYDLVVTESRGAPPLWARFYEIGTGRPMFCGRDGVVKYRLSEIDAERRTGYAWYTDAPAALLARDYPAWRAKTRREP